jgi:hypothetical protein
MENMLFHAHSGLRWLVMLMTVVAFVYLLVGAIQSKPFDKLTHRVVVIWSSLFGLQWLLGLVLFIVMGSTTERLEHMVTMTIALAVAHAYVPLKKRPDATRYYGILASILVVLVLIYMGVQRLPQGWGM